MIFSLVLNLKIALKSQETLWDSYWNYFKLYIYIYIHTHTQHLYIKISSFNTYQWNFIISSQDLVHFIKSMLRHFALQLLLWTRYFKIFFILTRGHFFIAFRDRGSGGEREREREEEREVGERNTDWLSSHTRRNWGLSWPGNQTHDPLVHGMTLQPSHTSQDRNEIFLKLQLQTICCFCFGMQFLNIYIGFIFRNVPELFYWFQNWSAASLRFSI